MSEGEFCRSMGPISPVAVLSTRGFLVLLARGSTTVPKVLQKYGYAVLLATALLGHLSVAHFLANEDDLDGDLYTQIATNVLEHHIYSKDTDPPLGPTLARVPGYPLFVAGIYALFGPGNDEALRLVQGVLNTLTCVLIAMLASMWEPRQRTQASVPR